MSLRAEAASKAWREAKQSFPLTSRDCFGKKRLAMTTCTQILALNEYILC
jgi:hypothetical protein